MIIEPDFVGHWKTKLLCDRLGSEAAPLRLLQLWGHCQLRKCDTFAFGPLVLKAVCGWGGDAQAFWEAMTDVHAGWLVPCPNDPEKWVVRGFLEVNGKLSASWVNGGKGGRPPKPMGNPTGTQSGTHGKPESNPVGTDDEPGNNLSGTRGKPHSIAKHSVAMHSSLAGAREGGSGPAGECGSGNAEGGMDAGASGTENEPPIPTGRDAARGTPTVSLNLQVDDAPSKTIEAWAEEIYQAYPRHEAKAAALRSIRKVLQKKKRGGERLDLLGVVRAYASAVGRWAVEDRQFIPLPSTWFNRGQFEDDPSTWERNLGEKKNEGGAGNGNGQRFERYVRPAVAIAVPKLHRELPEPPCAWRKVLQEMYPPEEFPDADYVQPWGMYEPEVRAEVVRWCVERGVLDGAWRQPGVPERVEE